MTARPKLKRTRVTLLMYAVNGVAAFLLYSIGPATPFLAEDLAVNGQTAALHGTALAGAIVMAGLTAARIIALIGRSRTVSAALVMLALGVLVVVLAPHVAISLVGTFIAGVGSGLCAITASATLTVVHPDVAAAVLTEGTAAGAWVGLLSPAAMGLMTGIGPGWQWGMALAIPMCLALLVALRGLGPAAMEQHAPSPGAPWAADAPAPDGYPDGYPASSQLPEVVTGPGPAASPADTAFPGNPAPPPAVADQELSTIKRGLPAAVWIVMLAIFAAAGAEFAINYWGSSLLTENTGQGAGLVTAAMSAPIAGVAVGRSLGAPLALRLPSHTMLWAGWLIALVGFVPFWVADSLMVAAAGLFVAGLGMSVTYPLLVDRCVLLMPEEPDRAVALASPSVGFAIGLAPFVLGALALEWGVARAFLLVPALMVAGLVAVAASRPRD